MAWDLARATVAVLGYGNQGEAHAQNLRDSGIRVRVGARPGGGGEARARAAGFEVSSLAHATSQADVASCLIPDEVFPEVFAAEIAHGLREDATLLLAHGFNLLYRPPTLGEAWDVVLVAPTGPGRVLRASFAAGGLPAYLAVHQDASGEAWRKAADYARAIGCPRTLRTTVREETEVDLFGEQVVLCGGMNALVTAAFETLVEGGYSPEIAYLECVYQLAYLAEMLQERGVTGMRRAISGTALFGDLTRGPRVLGDQGKARLHGILDDIRSGGFAREWLAAAAAHPFDAALKHSAAHPMERAREALERVVSGTAEGPDESRNALSKK